MKSVLSAALCVLAAPSVADEALSRFLSSEACAVGPGTYERAEAAGIDPARPGAFAVQALTDGRAVTSGDWIVLNADTCTIRPPVTASELSLDDPDVVATMHPVDTFPDDPGCYLSADALREVKIGQRGWDEDRFDRAYMAFLGAGLASGDLAFYSADPLVTPPGVQVMTGEGCDSPRNAAAIRDNQAWIAKEFDRIIRLSMAHNACADGRGPSALAWQAPESVGLLSGENTNALSLLAVEFIARGAGWYGPNSHLPAGEPRPPLCNAD